MRWRAWHRTTHPASSEPAASAAAPHVELVPASTPSIVVAAAAPHVELFTRPLAGAYTRPLLRESEAVDLLNSLNYPSKSDYVDLKMCECKPLPAAQRAAQPRDKHHVPGRSLHSSTSQLNLHHFW
jgi:hypothetical protein